MVFRMWWISWYWLFELIIWKFLGKLVFVWCVCSKWCVSLWKVLIYILCRLWFINDFIWLCIFLVVLLVKVIVKIEKGVMFLIFINYVMWCINMWVLLLLVLVKIRVLDSGVVIVLCCLLFSLFSSWDIFIVWYLLVDSVIYLVVCYYVICLLIYIV